MREAEKSKDKAVAVDRAKKAEQVLKSPLILSPKLNGPDTVARYKVLLNKAIALQGRSPDEKDEKKPDEEAGREEAVKRFRPGLWACLLLALRLQLSCCRRRT